MRLADILTVERVTVGLRAPDKPSALRALAKLFVDDDPELDADAIAYVFNEREQIASTGIGDGVAIPHGRMFGVERLVAAVGIAADGIDFDAIDGRPAYIFVALLGPKLHAGDHLKALARFSRLLRDAEVRSRLLAAKTRDEALDILVTEDQRR